LTKAPTGIGGFDELTHGGRATLPGGGPGSGKTIFGLGFIAPDARHCGEAGILVALEEHSSRTVANAEGFDWRPPDLLPRKLLFLDAEEAMLEVRAKSLPAELVAEKVEKTLLARTTESRNQALSRGCMRMRELRGGDVALRRRIGTGV
jgi:KaiC/GvpD/RAD55 family RecA-like ATPase